MTTITAKLHKIDGGALCFYVGPCALPAVKTTLELEDCGVSGAFMTVYAGRTPRRIGSALLLDDAEGWRGVIPIENLAWDAIVRREGNGVAVTLSAPDGAA